MPNIVTIPVPRKNKSEKFSKLVKELRTKYSLTKKNLAHLSCIDPSYITLMERDGLLPAAKTLDLMRQGLINFGASPIDFLELYIEAGFFPPDMTEGMLDDFRYTYLSSREEIEKITLK